MLENWTMLPIMMFNYPIVSKHFTSTENWSWLNTGCQTSCLATVLLCFWPKDDKMSLRTQGHKCPLQKPFPLHNPPSPFISSFCPARITQFYPGKNTFSTNHCQGDMHCVLGGGDEHRIYWSQDETDLKLHVDFSNTTQTDIVK